MPKKTKRKKKTKAKPEEIDWEYMGENIGKKMEDKFKKLENTGEYDKPWFAPPPQHPRRPLGIMNVLLPLSVLGIGAYWLLSELGFITFQLPVLPTCVTLFGLAWLASVVFRRG